MSGARRRRGRDTEIGFARWLTSQGWPYAMHVGSAASGADITGTPGLAFELKARAGFDPAAWLRQAESRPGLPVAVLRLNGQGLTDPGEWAALLRVRHLVPLLHAAGYGDPIDLDTPTLGDPA